MLRAFVLIALLGSAIVARAAQHVTLEELERILAQQQAMHASDADAASQLGTLELNERLTALRLARLKTQFVPGKKSAKQLDVLADESAFLELPARELPRAERPSMAEQQEMLKAAASFANVTLKHLPDFLATRTTSNFEDVPILTKDMSVQSGMHAVGMSTDEVAYRGGLEYASQTTETRGPAHAPVPNLSSAGEFGPVLATIMSDSEHGKIAWDHWEQSPEGAAGVFRYEVPKQAAHYTISFCCGWDEASGVEKSYRGRPAYHGTIAVNPSTGAILRVTVEADIDAFDPVQHFGLVVEYGKVEISGSSLGCPLRSAVIFRAVAMARKRSWDVIHVNDVTFSDYRRFGSAARIVPNSAR